MHAPRLTPRQQHYLRLMGIEVWLERGAGTGGEPATPPAAAADAPVAEPEAGADWEGLQAEVAACTRCELHRRRTHTVFGSGNPAADWMLIGEAPGAEEDRQGKPFVGRAGKLLTAMLQAIGLDRDEVFIANILKCRPPDNRDPQATEVAACSDYLQRQIRLIRPRIILALGRIAAQNLLREDTPLARMRGRRHTCPGTGIPVVVTYHPAYLLRSPTQKRKSWQDLQFALSIFREPR